VLVAETPPLDETAPPDPTRTAEALASRKTNGRPFTKGNKAACGRGPSLTRVLVDGDAPEERRRVQRRANSLEGTRRRELSVQCGGPVSSGVRTEIVAWARNVAWAEHFDRQGDAVTAAALAEKASAHQLKAIGIAERESKARAPKTPTDPLAAFRLPGDK
jgi:hypothetical protein